MNRPTNATEFIHEPYAHELLDQPNIDFFVSRFDYDEIKESIIQDILCFTMLKQEKEDVAFTFKELTMYVNDRASEHIAELLLSPDVSKHIEIINESYYIKKDPTSLQAAMDYCGVWYDGFNPPEDVTVFRMTDAGEKVMKDPVLLNNLIKDVDIETNKNIDGPTTVQ